MVRLIAISTLMIATVASANPLKLQYEENDDENFKKWTYLVTRSDQQEPLIVRLEIPECTYVSLKSPNSATLQQERLDGNWLELTFTDTQSENQSGEQKFIFEVIDLRSITMDGKIKWTTKNPNDKGRIYGPTVLYDPSLIRFIFTVGISHKWDDFVNFKTDNNVLLVENDSRLRPSAFIGFLLELFDFQKVFFDKFRMKEKKTVDLLVSLEFAKGTSNILDGFVGGVGFGVNRYLEIFGGVSVRTGQEISFGFKQATKRLSEEIEALPGTTDENRRIKLDFARFKNEDDEYFKADEYYDGLSTISPITNKPIFPGSPLTNSTNKAWVFGIAIPLDLLNIIRNKNQ